MNAIPKKPPKRGSNEPIPTIGAADGNGDDGAEQLPAQPTTPAKRPISPVPNGNSAQPKRRRLIEPGSPPGISPLERAGDLDDDETAAEAAAALPPIPQTQTALQQHQPRSKSKRSFSSFLREYTGSDEVRVDAYVSAWFAFANCDGSCSPPRDKKRRRQQRVQDELRGATRSAPPTVMNPSRNTDSDGMPPPPLPRSYRSEASRGGTHSSGSRGRWSAPSASAYGGSSRGGGSSTQSSKKSLVENPQYRIFLGANKIRLMTSDAAAAAASARPAPVSMALVDSLDGIHHPHPPLSDAEQRETEKSVEALMLSGAAEEEVVTFYDSRIFPPPALSDVLQRQGKLPMLRGVVPVINPQFKISTPVPDLLYGYNVERAFSPQLQVQLISVDPSMSGAANSQSLMFPFLLVEFKGDGASGAGSMWVATNQCLGGAAACVNIVERLNSQLVALQPDPSTAASAVSTVDSTVFSIAMNATEARLFVSWKQQTEQDLCVTQFVKGFLLCDMKQFLDFRNYVLNILEWGRTVRLAAIQTAVDRLLEASSRNKSQEAKSRPPPGPPFSDSDDGNDDCASSSSRESSKRARLSM